MMNVHVGGGGLQVSEPLLYPQFIVVGDGILDVDGYPVTDRTAALQAAVDACAARPGGGVVWILGPIRVRDTITVAGSTFRAPGQPANPVTIRSASGGSYGDFVYWDPTNNADDFVWFVPWGPSLPYVGGGVANLEVVVRDNLCTGKMVRLEYCYQTVVENVWVSCGSGSGGAVGFHIEDGPNPGETSQHCRWFNLNAQGIEQGCDITGVQEFIAIGLNLNQCVKAGVIRSGTIVWYGGLEQGNGTVLELRPPTQNSIFLSIKGGLYFEAPTSAPTVKGYPPVDTGPGGFGGYVVIEDCTNNGDITLVDIDGYTLRLANIKGVPATMIRAVRSTITGIELGGNAGNYDIDADTATRCTWVNGGVITVGTAFPNSGSALAFIAGKPIVPPSYTLTQRVALTGMVPGAFLRDSTLGLPMMYDGAEFQPIGEINAQTVLGANLLHHFFSPAGAGANTWTDIVGGLVFTGSGGPTRVADGANFRGLPVWTFVAASSQYMDTGGAGATIYAAGVGAVYVRMVCRLTSLAACAFFNATPNSLAANELSIQDSAGPTIRGTLSGAVNVTGNTATTDVMVLELFLDALGVRRLFINGVDTSEDPTTGVTLANNVQRIAIGAFPGPVLPSDIVIAELMLCTSVPTSEQRAALDERDAQVWGI